MSESDQYIRTGRGVDIAFSVVVLASYFSIFSAINIFSSVRIFLLILLGVSYIGIGVYGYSYCAKKDSLWLKLVYFGIQIIQGGVIVYLGEGVGFNAMVLLPLTGHSVLLLSGKLQYAINFFVFLTYVLAIFSFNPTWEGISEGIPIFFAGQIFIIVFTQMALTEEKSRAEVERLLQNLTKANQRLRDYIVQVEELATEKERNRLAREIHDGLGHCLTTVNIQLEAAKITLSTDPQKAGYLIDTAQKLTRDALVDVRKSVAALRSPLDDHIPIEDQVKKILSHAEVSGIKTNFVVKGESRSVEPNGSLTIFRIVQEGINNVCKHSKASTVNVVMDYTLEDRITIEVHDNGIGMNGQTGGFGLLGLRERIQFLQGEMQIISVPGAGFTLRAIIPG